MKQLRRVTESEVIAEFLKTSFPGGFHRDREQFEHLVLDADVTNDEENMLRRALLFRRRGHMWRELPSGYPMVGSAARCRRPRQTEGVSPRPLAQDCQWQLRASRYRRQYPPTQVQREDRRLHLQDPFAKLSPAIRSRHQLRDPDRRQRGRIDHHHRRQSPSHGRHAGRAGNIAQPVPRLLRYFTAHERSLLAPPQHVQHHALYPEPPETSLARSGRGSVWLARARTAGFRTLHQGGCRTQSSTRSK